MGKNDWINLIVDIVLLVLGVFFVFNQSHAFTAMVLILGGIFFLYGVFQLAVWLWNRMKRGDQESLSSFWTGALCMIAGICFFIFYEPFGTELLPVATALWMLILSVVRIVIAVRFWHRHIPMWWIPLISAGFTFAAGAVILCSSFLAGFTLGNDMISMITGVCFIVFSCLGFGELALLLNHGRNGTSGRDGTSIDRTTSSQK